MKSHSDRSNFEKELAKNGITVLFLENEQGHIYGVTFIDHEQKAVFNGSRLRKEFSANVLNDLFKECEQKEEHTKQVAGKEPFAPLVRQSDHIESAVGSLFSILSPEPESYPDNQYPLPKKRKYGRQI